MGEAVTRIPTRIPLNSAEAREPACQPGAQLNCPPGSCWVQGYRCGGVGDRFFACLSDGLILSRQLVLRLFYSNTCCLAKANADAPGASRTRTINAVNVILTRVVYTVPGIPHLVRLFNPFGTCKGKNSRPKITTSATAW